MYINRQQTTRPSITVVCEKSYKYIIARIFFQQDKTANSIAIENQIVPMW